MSKAGKKRDGQTAGFIKSILVVLVFVFFPFTVTRAYVGPGVGITMLGTFWFFVSVVGVFVAGLLIWPVRSFFRRKKEASQADSDDEKKT